MSEVISAVYGALGTERYVILYLICLVFAIVLFRGNRKDFAIPSLILTIVICNPFFYNLWNKINGYAYWRTLWVIPVVSMCAAIPSFFVEKMNNHWMRVIVIVVFALLFVNTGYFIYNNPDTTFAIAMNSDKLPNEVVQIGKYLLEIDENPSVVCEANISTYIRQYSGKIITPYGRDIIVGGADQDASDIYRHLTLNEMGQLSTHMLNGGYEYLVIRDDGGKKEEELEQAGFELLERICGNRIYRLKGQCSESSEYDERGRLIRKNYYDMNGDLLEQEAGYVAYTQEWRENTLMTRTYLDKNDNPINRIDGYSKVVFNGNNIEFYDNSGEKVDFRSLNLVKDVNVDTEGWSEWITPFPNMKNFVYILGTTHLGKKEVGQEYTCYVEIEFKDVRTTQEEAFCFWTQGAADGHWSTKNVWNPELVNLEAVPANGIYCFLSTVKLDEAMTRIREFEIGFRCDYWSSGAFRVKNVSIKQGNSPGKWSPGV